MVVFCLAIFLLFALVAKAPFAIITLCLLISGYLCVRLIRKPQLSKVAVLPAPISLHQDLGNQVKELFNELMVPLKDELRKYRSSTAYSDLFEGDIRDIVCRFAALDGTVDPEEGLVFKSIFGRLHPKQFGWLTGTEAAKLIEGIVQKHPEVIQNPVQKPPLIRVAEQVDASKKTFYAIQLGALLYEVAKQVAVADGPLTEQENSELAKLRTIFEHNSPKSPPEGVARALSPDRSSSPVGPYTTDAQFSELTTGERPPEGVPLEPGDPAKVIVKADQEYLRSVFKTFVHEAKDSLKPELRKIRMSGSANDIIEQDVRKLIIQCGLSGSHISSDAASLYLALFRSLHPRTYSGWDINSAVDLLETIARQNAKLYYGPVEKPLTLKFLASPEIPTRIRLGASEMFFRIAQCAATINGNVPLEKQALISDLKSLFQAN